MGATGNRPPVFVGHNPVDDLELAALSITRVAAGGKLTQAPFKVGTRDVVVDKPALVQMTGGKLPLDRVLALYEPVHRPVAVIGVGALKAKIHTERRVAPPACGGRLCARAYHPSHDKRQGQIALLAGRTQKGRKPEPLGLAHHGRHMTMWQRAKNLDPAHRPGRFARRPTRVTLGHPTRRRCLLTPKRLAHKLDHLGRQVREVPERAMAHLAALAEALAQQMRDVLALTVPPLDRGYVHRTRLTP